MPKGRSNLWLRNQRFCSLCVSEESELTAAVRKNAGVKGLFGASFGLCSINPFLLQKLSITNSKLMV
jgi:hypothetical protein